MQLYKQWGMSSLSNPHIQFIMRVRQSGTADPHGIDAYEGKVGRRGEGRIEREGTGEPIDYRSANVSLLTSNELS
jgi:hypothetical protein